MSARRQLDKTSLGLGAVDSALVHGRPLVRRIVDIEKRPVARRDVEGAKAGLLGEQIASPLDAELGAGELREDAANCGDIEYRRRGHSNGLPAPLGTVPVTAQETARWRVWKCECRRHGEHQDDDQAAQFEQVALEQCAPHQTIGQAPLQQRLLAKAITMHHCSTARTDGPAAVAPRRARPTWG